MRTDRQSGSAHVAAVVILIVVLLGALSFIFYRNFMTDSAEQPTSQQAPVPVKMQTARFEYDKQAYAIDYPKGWSESVLDPASKDKNLTLTSPSSSVEVQFSVSAGGLGGMCDATDGLKVRFYQVSKETNVKLTDEPLRLVESMSDAQGGGYSYRIGLSPEGAETHAAVGDSHCTIGYVGVASRLVVDQPTGKVSRPTIIAMIRFPKLPGTSDSKVKSMDEIEGLMQTDEYKAAVKILQSARKE